MARNFNKGIFDEYGCFNINDFKRGDNVVATNRRTKERRKGIVISTNERPATVTFKDIEGEVHTVRLNDITFLQPHEKGWLER